PSSRIKESSKWGIVWVPHGRAAKQGPPTSDRGLTDIGRNGRGARPTCLPGPAPFGRAGRRHGGTREGHGREGDAAHADPPGPLPHRSEERRVGKEWRSQWA